MLAITLDTTDWNILGALQQEARIASIELARKVHLSPSPCLARVRRLERFIVDFLSRVPGVGNIQSSFALKQVKYKTQDRPAPAAGNASQSGFFSQFPISPTTPRRKVSTQMPKMTPSKGQADQEKIDESTYL